ncbi:hypothetical protein E8E13_002426 [Curvularia kusanoi]|uniref:Uncharacterized protein n=1 Tax=Curvularia kusanoi TaxID=90978 RepID=A0A9P4T580_CURKU|nr:hypothetical protein E8E13_002426 [Curvularia kusanoi]
MANVALPSRIQQASILVLWREYGLQSDGSFFNIGGNLSLVFLNNEQNEHFTNHLRMARGIQPTTLQEMIRDFEELAPSMGIERCSIGSPSSHVASDYSNVPMSAGTQASNYGTVPSPASAPTPTPAVLPGSAGLKATATVPVNVALPITAASPTPAFIPLAEIRPARKRPIAPQCINESGDGRRKSVRCPGDKGQGQCFVGKKKLWTARVDFEAHFEDKHMPSYETTTGISRCDCCGETFPTATRRGKDAFTKHTWARLRAEKQWDT